MRICLLSCGGREDVIAFWHMTIDRFWPDCPWPIDVLDSPTMSGWTKRFLAYLEQLDDRVVMPWLDDQFACEPIGSERLKAPHDYLLSDTEMVGIFVSRVPEPRDDSALSGYGIYPYLEPTYHMSQIAPSFWKRARLVEICEGVLRQLRDVQDAGWPGAYNWELAAPRVINAEGWHIAGPLRSKTAPIKVINGVAQNRWTPLALRLASRLSIELDLSRGVYAGIENDSYVDDWRLARRAATAERAAEIEKAQEEAKEER